MKKILFTAVIATTLFACKSETKPAFDLIKAKAEIEAANKNIIKDIISGDSVAAANDYSKDGKLMVGNTSSITGQNNIAAFWGGFSKTVTTFTLTTNEVWGDENYITEEGTYEITPKENKPHDKGKYIVLWKKEDGKWKLHRDISNSDLPAATN